MHCLTDEGGVMYHYRETFLMENTLLCLHCKNTLHCKNLAAPDLSNSLKLLNNAFLRLWDKNKYKVSEILKTFVSEQILFLLQHLKLRFISITGLTVISQNKLYSTLTDYINERGSALNELAPSKEILLTISCFYFAYLLFRFFLNY